MSEKVYTDLDSAICPGYSLVQGIVMVPYVVPLGGWELFTILPRSVLLEIYSDFFLLKLAYVVFTSTISSCRLGALFTPFDLAICEAW